MRTTCETVILGTVVGGLMGVHLRAAMTGGNWVLSAGDGLGPLMMVWQTAVGASSGIFLRPRGCQDDEPPAGR